MKKLRLGFVDTFGAVEQFFTEVLSREYDIERDDEKPEYLIFGDRNFGNKNSTQFNYSLTKCRRIFFTGENERPKHYSCHHSISFDHGEGDNYRLPLYVIYDWDNKRKKVNNSDNYARDFMDIPKKGANFCSFVVKNPGCQKRNEFFHKLSAYRKVDAGGPLFNNMGNVLAGGAIAVEAKAAFLPQYKFNMCFENSSHPGYVTEKLYEALVFQTVPIYWGSPTVALDFNPRAFISWHDYQDDDVFLEKIKEIDGDDALYSMMYLEPMFVNYDKTPVFNLDRFVHWFNKNVYRG
jgi:hypothetical protein